MKGLILSGGHGTRLKPITHTSNKHLIPLANKPMLFYGIETLKNAGITDIGIIVGHTPQRIQEIKEGVGDGSKLGVKVTYIEQDAPRGIAHAIRVAKDFLTDSNPDGKFVVHLGDNILQGGIKKYVEKFSDPNIDGIFLFKEIPEIERRLNTWGSPIIKDGKLMGIVEKPEVPLNNYAFVGVYFLTNAVFDIIDRLKLSPRNEYEIADACSGLIESGGNVLYEIVNVGWWKDPGNSAGILEANRLLLDDLVPYNKGIVEDGVAIIGKVAIGEGTIIKRGASVRGPTIIGKNCIIGSNAYVGPYTSVGDNCIIGNVEIESSIIMSDCRIECEKRIMDSLIGRNVTIVSARDSTPKGTQLVLGENSSVSI